MQVWDSRASDPMPRNSDSDAQLQQCHVPPEEPYIEELEDDDLEFPPLQETPMDDDAVIPPRVIDMLLIAPDEDVMASLEEVSRVCSLAWVMRAKELPPSPLPPSLVDVVPRHS